MSSRICHISTAHQTYDTRIFHKECKSLAAAGHEVFLVIRSVKGDHERDGVKIRVIKAWNRRLPRAFFGSMQALWRCLGTRAEWVFLHDPELIPIGLVLRLFGKKVVFDMHELVIAQIGDKQWLGKGKGLALDAYAWFEGMAVKKFRHILLAEEGYWDYIRAAYPKYLDKFVLLRNFPDLNRIDAIPAKPRSDKGFRLIYAGGITEIRGVKEMVEAIAPIHVRLDLLGAWETQELKAVCSQMKGWSRVDVHGPVQFEEVIAHLKSANCGLAILHPVKNYTTSLPVKVFEYLSCGIPVIASDFPLWREMFPKGVVFVDPKDGLALSAAILKMANDPERAREMGREGRELVESKYNWSSEAGRMIDFI